MASGAVGPGSSPAGGQEARERSRPGYEDLPTRCNERPRVDGKLQLGGSQVPPTAGRLLPHLRKTVDPDPRSDATGDDEEVPVGQRGHARVPASAIHAGEPGPGPGRRDQLRAV